MLSPTAFYMPKILLCFGVWVYLVSVGVLSQENTRNVSLPLRIAGIIFCSLYFIYLATISNYVLKLVKNMKKAYKILVQVTLCVIGISMVLLFSNGQMSQYDMPILYFA